MQKCCHLCVVAILAAILNAPSALAAEKIPHLYEARIIVTGAREETRLPALPECLKDVLVKVSGDPRLLADQAAASLAKSAPALVASFRFRDRLAGIQIHDEQGTRDRPYDLFVTFDSEKVDASLRTLGRKPWTAPRSAVVMFLAVNNDAVTYLLASDGSRGRDQRESLEAAAWQMGMHLTLPSEGDLKKAGLSVETLPAADAGLLDRAAKAAGGDWPLAGTLKWSKGTLGWAADWRLTRPEKSYAWQIRDVNFDDAFRSAVRGAAQIASGNGAPK